MGPLGLVKGDYIMFFWATNLGSELNNVVRFLFVCLWQNNISLIAYSLIIFGVIFVLNASFLLDVVLGSHIVPFKSTDAFYMEVVGKMLITYFFIAHSLIVFGMIFLLNTSFLLGVVLRSVPFSYLEGEEC
jgi:hypothetical protein